MVSMCHTPHVCVIDLAASTPSIKDAEIVHQALEESCRRMTARGAHVHLLSSTYVPAESRWLCVFVAEDGDVARRTVDMAQIPERRVREAIDLMTLPANDRAIA